MNEPNRTSYDELPYQGQAFAFTHPDHLATVATVMGLNPAWPDDCRVLELGCGDGHNLIPMAESLPNATFIGIDLAKSHTDTARRLAEDMKMSNVRFEQMDLMELPEDFGTFDYIICHGVYSWVPSVVQDRILEVCDGHLSDNGIALVSFNAYPGWHARRMIRDMTRRHADTVDTPKEKLRLAREFLESFASGISQQSDPYSQLIRGEVEKARRHPDYYFFHEHLEDVNSPCYLHEFAAQAEAHNLRYISDVELPLTLPVSGAPGLERFLASVPADRVSQDQHLDFTTNRTFRKSLLCRWKNIPSRDPVAERVIPMFVSSGGRRASDRFELMDTSEMAFQTYDGETTYVSVPLVKAAFLRLTEISPAKITFRQLLIDAYGKLGQNSAGQTERSDVQLLAHWILGSHRNSPASLVHVSCVPPRCASEISDHPVVSPVARHIASLQLSVTNRRHERLGDDATYLTVLPLLDGSLDRHGLEEAIGELQRRGKLQPLFPGESSQQMTRRLLVNFLQFGLFMAESG